MITNILAFILAYLGIVLGLILAYSAKEEIKPGKRYFLLMQRIILASILLTILTFLIYGKNFISLLMLIPLIILYLYKFKNLFFTYLLFSIITFFTLKDDVYLLLTLTLIFLYGIPTGTLLVDFRDLKKTLRTILIPAAYIIFTTILYFIGNYI